MLNLDTEAVANALPYDQLMDALAIAFAANVEVPKRTHIDVPVPGGAAGNLLLMPAWKPGGGMGVKIATIFPDNATKNYPAVFATYVLMSAETGAPVAVLDGGELTLRRTAAASALASRHLSREDASRLLMVGTGNLAPHLIAAHATARQLSEVLIWGRRPEAAERLAHQVAALSCKVTIARDLEDAVLQADIISCATLSREPLIRGAWLQSGQHLDLVGAFRPDMREADTEAVVRASVFVDTRDGTGTEAGEIVQALQSKAISEEHIRGELHDLVTGAVPGRRSDNEITLFKSVGTALEDLAAAELAISNSQAANQDVA